MKSILSNNFQLRLESNRIPSRTAPVPAALPTCSHSIQSTLKRSNPSQDSPGDCSYLWRISDESLTNLWGISQSSSKVSSSPELKSESISRVEMPRQCPNNQRGESRKNLAESRRIPLTSNGDANTRSGGKWLNSFVIVRFDWMLNNAIRKPFSR